MGAAFTPDGTGAMRSACRITGWRSFDAAGLQPADPGTTVNPGRRYACPGLLYFWAVGPLPEATRRTSSTTADIKSLRTGTTKSVVREPGFDAPLTDNLKAWLAPWRHESGPVVTLKCPSNRLSQVAVKAGIPDGWRQNALRHSFISYRVAETGDVPRTALEAGTSPKMIFRHYREVVDAGSAKDWFLVMPPEGWVPKDLPGSIRLRLQKLMEKAS